MGGKLCFFVNDQVKIVPRHQGSLVQHHPKVLHGVTSVTEGTRKSLFVVDESNELGMEGVVTLSQGDIDSFSEHERAADAGVGLPPAELEQLGLEPAEALEATGLALAWQLSQEQEQENERAAHE